MTKRALTRAAILGNRAGEDAAYWAIQDLWGGRVTRGETEAAAAFLKAFDDGDDTGLCEPQLSGEYSDEPTPQSLAIDCGLDEDADPDDVDELCSMWEQACSEAYWGTLERSAREQVAPEEPAAAYDWELTRYGAGILTRLSDGYSVFMQGDDASQFDDEWEACETDEQYNMLGSAYDDVMDAPRP